MTVTVEKTPDVVFFDDFEGDLSPWTSTGVWGVAETGCCGAQPPSPTHVWRFGNGQAFFGSGLLTSPAFEVSGLERLDVSFWQCLHVAAGIGVHVSVEVAFDGVWQTIWEAADLNSGGWEQVGSLTIDVPAGAVNMQVRFRMNSRYGWGTWCIDDLLVCLLYTSPSPRDLSTSRMPSSA